MKECSHYKIQKIDAFTFFWETLYQKIIFDIILSQIGMRNGMLSKDIYMNEIS